MRDILSIYRPTIAISVHENDYHVQGWNPQTIFFENCNEWCMTDLDFTPQFKYRTLICCQNIIIFIIYRPTRAISFHENDQHDKVWNPTTNFSKTTKKEKRYLIYF